VVLRPHKATLLQLTFARLVAFPASPAQSPTFGSSGLLHHDARDKP
jgi:hypothetical protein